MLSVTEISAYLIDLITIIIIIIETVILTVMNMTQMRVVSALPKRGPTAENSRCKGDFGHCWSPE